MDYVLVTLNVSSIFNEIAKKYDMNMNLKKIIEVMKISTNEGEIKIVIDGRQWSG